MARVLLIEDEPMVRIMTRRMLAEGSHEVLDTADPESALRNVREFGAQVVVTDMMMSGQDGIALLLGIRRAFPDLPLIAISGRHPPEVLQRLQSHGLERGVWFVGKPFNQADLLVAVSTALSASW